MSSSLFLPLLPLEGPITRHLPEKITHADSRGQSLVEFEHNLQNAIETHSQNGQEKEAEAMKRELHNFEEMKLSEKERWVEFKENQGVPLRNRSVAGAYQGGVVLM